MKADKMAAEPEPQNNSVDGIDDQPTGIVARLRNYDTRHDGDIDEAADMLEFFFGQMQMHSPDMGGQHSYRFRSSGWPMTHCKGPSAEAAVKSAIQETKRAREPR